MTSYARIEGGAECERWLPLLFAIVDGEATPDQLMEIRPHLRHCTACRATVRELHSTSAPLAALFPIALAPSAADHGHERAAGFFVRLYEAVAGGIHERAASAALKVQAAAEAASAGKLAAIAASAAAIAGGGAVVANTAATADHRRPSPRSASCSMPLRSRPQPFTPRSRPVAQPLCPHRRHPRRPAPPGIETSFAARHRHTARTEFASISTAAALPAAATPASAVVHAGSPEPSAASHEFASEFGG